ncbi:MAG: hypothetical protein ACFFBD_17025 [Candidatus Hodarchaeota archaeon]
MNELIEFFRDVKKQIPGRIVINDPDNQSILIKRQRRGLKIL